MEPHGVVHTDRRWYLVAWCTTRHDWRTFRIDRITAAPVVGAHFSPRAGPGDGDLRTWVAQSLSLAQSSEPARIILHAPLAAMRRQIPDTAGQLEHVDAQRCLLRCSANPAGAIVYWLMALDLGIRGAGSAGTAGQAARRRATGGAQPGTHGQLSRAGFAAPTTAC
ncbi:WYL domain-containing protein [Stenotrophomonas rhizophila]